MILLNITVTVDLLKSFCILVNNSASCFNVLFFFYFFFTFFLPFTREYLDVLLIYKLFSSQEQIKERKKKSTYPRFAETKQCCHVKEVKMVSCPFTWSLRSFMCEFLFSTKFSGPMFWLLLILKIKKNYCSFKTVI